MTIAYITDLHLEEELPPGIDAEKNWQAVFENLTHHNIDEIVIGGDIGLANSHETFFDSLYGYSEKINITLGNHDSFDDVKKYYDNPEAKHRNELFYRYRFGKYDVFFLDSSSDTISRQQLDWLSDSLKDAKADVVIFIHHPILAVDSPVDAKYPLRNRAELERLLRESGKEITIFCGHYHTTDEIADGNIRQFVTHAVSYQIEKGTVEIERDISYFGYRIIYLDEAGITTELISLRHQ